MPRFRAASCSSSRVSGPSVGTGALAAGITSALPIPAILGAVLARSFELFSTLVEELKRKPDERLADPFPRDDVGRSHGNGGTGVAIEALERTAPVAISAGDGKPDRRDFVGNLGRMD